MKKLLILIVAFVIISCNNNIIDDSYRDAPTQFIVVDMENKEGMKEMIAYKIEVIDVNKLSHGAGSSDNLIFWISDTVGKYKLGQPIHFDKRR